jgi:multicomponent Na+:H+ antiporter subunit D
VLLWHVAQHGTISYAIGDWRPPIGIEYRVDAANALMLVLIAGVAALILPFAHASVGREIAEDRQHLFYCMLLLCVTGMLGMTVTGDAFNVFVFLEIASLSTYSLIALGRDRRALVAAFRYLVMGTVGATFFVIGVGLAYMMTGTLNMVDLGQRLNAVSDSRPVLAAFAFITVGLALKFTLFPLHLWLPNAYTYAPSVVSALLAATATKVSIYVLLRFTYTVFGGSFAFEQLPLGWVLFVPALAGMFAGTVNAMFQNDARRLLAYSSVAQVGYIALAISLSTAAGVAGGFAHVVAHGLAKATLFCGLGAVFFRRGSVRLRDLAGVGRKMPFTAAAIVVGGLSLIGVPATAGFASKWLILQAALGLGLWWVAALLLAASLLAIIYVWRLLEAIYFQPASPRREQADEAPLSMLLPTLAFALLTIAFGLAPNLLIGAADGAARALLGGAP